MENFNWYRKTEGLAGHFGPSFFQYLQLPGPARNQTLNQNLAK